MKRSVADRKVWAVGESRLNFGLLGPLQVAVAGAQLPLGTPKQRAVLAMLLINRNRTVSTDTLIDGLWGQSPAAAARASIHTYVSNLRNLFATAGFASNLVLTGVSSGYRLNVPDGDADLDLFFTEKTAGFLAAAAGHFERASRHFGDALALWRGPILHDLLGMSFIELFAAALDEDRLVVQTTRAEAEIACGRAHSVISELESLVADHPYREPLWAQLITAYYISDRQSDALSAYQRLRNVLAEDLGIDPSPTIAELHERILRQERLDIKQSAKTAAALTVFTTINGAVAGRSAKATLRDSTGRKHPLTAAATSIGRLAENDIVLDDSKISRRHAVIVDTGSSFVITDLGSTNGVEVEGQRVRPSAALAHGQHIRVGRHEFTFEVEPD